MFNCVYQWFLNNVNILKILLNPLDIVNETPYNNL